MKDFQREKAVVRTFYSALDSADADIAAVLQQHTAEAFKWRGFHPFGELTKHQLVKQFWQPLRSALTAIQRREDIVFAGLNEIDGFDSVWVVSMGHLMGLFDQSWLGIQPTGKMTFLRYCEFSRVEDNQIAESAMYFDLPHLMTQAGYQPFASQTGAQLVQPGPLTNDGLLHSAQPPAHGEETLALINRMIGDLGQWNSNLSLEEELRLSWADDMIWWGPTGIGATYTIKRYAQQHAAPFRAGLTDRSKTRHVARLAEGHYGGFFGWPNFTARSTGGFIGLPASDTIGEFRVIDIYRRQGNRLAENWVFIDLPHLCSLHGVELIHAP